MASRCAVDTKIDSPSVQQGHNVAGGLPERRSALGCAGRRGSAGERWIRGKLSSDATRPRRLLG
jgi:hypothetical protein